jgi:hypothetical protein
MDAKSILLVVARAMREQELEAILIGNAAAALRGAPVTTVDLDFLIRKTMANRRKIERMADALGGVVFVPHYPVSGLYRLIRDDDQLQLDFMTQAHGVRSFNSLRSRATILQLGAESLAVASLADIIASKRAADRPRDRAILHVLEKTLEEESHAGRSLGSSEAPK